jgi:hypothetical protein
MHLAQFIGFPAFVLLSISRAPGGHCQGVNMMAALYLMFQIFTAGPGFATKAGKQAISKLPEPAFVGVEAKKFQTSRVSVEMASTGSGSWCDRSRWTTPALSGAHSRTSVSVRTRHRATRAARSNPWFRPGSEPGRSACPAPAYPTAQIVSPARAWS